MRIAYNTKTSSFHKTIQAMIQKNISTLERGYQIRITLDKGGGWKVGEIEMVIQRRGIKNFKISRKYSKQQNFSARLTALASVLKTQQLYGTFKVSHNDGLIFLKKIVENKICKTCYYYIPVPITNKFLDDSESMDDYPFCRFYDDLHDDFSKVKPNDSCSNWKSNIEESKRFIRELIEEKFFEKRFIIIEDIKDFANSYRQKMHHKKKIPFNASTTLGLSSGFDVGLTLLERFACQFDGLTREEAKEIIKHFDKKSIEYEFSNREISIWYLSFADAIDHFFLEQDDI